jgi:serpin B
LARQAPDANILLSPASVAFALAMTAEGASGTTWTAMARTLGVDPRAPEALGPETAAELSSLAAQHGVELTIANAIWASAGRPFVPAFLANTRRWYGADVTSLVLHGPAAKARIDAWGAHATNGKITTILQDTLTDAAAMVLTNAVYFDGHWLEAFDSSATASHAFTRGDGTMVSRPLMWRLGHSLYLRDNGFQAVRLAYQEDRLAMYVFLPDSGTRLAQIEAQLDTAHWTRWMRTFHVEHVHIALPRFGLEYSASLTGPLQALGMGIAFDRRSADFSHMLPRSALADSNVFIDRVLQKTYVDVSEQGTKAAAVTSVDMSVVDSAAPDPPLEFVVDRPFCLVIRDDRTGLILFIGQITDPAPDR